MRWMRWMHWIRWMHWMRWILVFLSLPPGPSYIFVLNSVCGVLKSWERLRMWVMNLVKGWSLIPSLGLLQVANTDLVISVLGSRESIMLYYSIIFYGLF
jgi:hypothetical protein